MELANWPKFMWTLICRAWSKLDSRLKKGTLHPCVRTCDPISVHLIFFARQGKSTCIKMIWKHHIATLNFSEESDKVLLNRFSSFWANIWMVSWVQTQTVALSLQTLPLTSLGFKHCTLYRLGFAKPIRCIVETNDIWFYICYPTAFPIKHACRPTDATRRFDAHRFFEAYLELNHWKLIKKHLDKRFELP